MMVTSTDRAMTRVCIILSILTTAGFLTGFFVATPITAGLASFMALAGWLTVELLEKRIERQ